jgi:subtilase family serine protease
MSMRRLVPLAIAAVVGVSTALVPAFGDAAQAAPTLAPSARSCSATPPAGYATCYALRRTDVSGRLAQPGAAPNVAGYGPTQLRDAYKLPSTNHGSGHTVAIVDAFDDPNAEADLGVYRSQFGLPACTTANGCFTKVNQNGATSPLPASDAGWSQEISLDLDMASAVCPLCHILLIEANNASFTNLETGVLQAGTLGATVVSLSWGSGKGFEQIDVANSPYHQTGRPIFVSSGDSGYGIQYPATSRYVIAVGGTHLVTNGSARGWTESAWGTTNSNHQGTGSGCSSVNPAVAPASFNTGCSMRAETDVSAVADPATGVAVYDSFGQPGWLVFGGTSAAAPIAASAVALLANVTTVTPQAVYAVNPLVFFDVTTGANGTCNPMQLCRARVGWDGPTGRGTPNFSFLH